MEPGVRTLLGGWSEEAGVYAYWDSRKHTRFSQKSPSLQVNLNTLESAGTVGIATQLRPTVEGQEVVAAVAPASLLWYIENGLQLHNAESDASAVVDLVDATPEDEREFLDSAESEIQAARRYDLVETMRAYRDAKFRPAVLQAYGYRCAVCNCDLKLVDAAHVVPVSHPRSTDEVTNGVALCRLHHGAFDNGLLGVQSTYRVVVNPLIVRRLHEIGLDTGIEHFRHHLPKLIRVPASIEARPLPELLKLGMQLRGFPTNLIG
jgi:putative restriction endonuclease